nr:integrase, catalytic region, zinc finger, CCHC-type, peptidase aspartic, catalytic [Tanacetum cinerariifolium]
MTKNCRTCKAWITEVNILKSIDEGPYKMGTVRETLADSTEGAPQFGSKRSRVYSDLTSEEKDWFAKLINDMRNIKMTMSKLQLNSKFVNIMLAEWASTSTQVPPPLDDSSSPAEDLIENLTNTLALLTQSYKTFLPQTNNQLRTSSNARNQATVQDGRVAQENRVDLDAEQLLFLVGGQDNAFDDDVDEQPAQDLALNIENVFQADDCDAFDSDVDEAPTTQTMFMANLSFADPVTDEAGPSYD